MEKAKSRGAVSVLAYAIKFCVTLNYTKLIITIFWYVNDSERPNLKEHKLGLKELF